MLHYRYDKHPENQSFERLLSDIQKQLLTSKETLKKLVEEEKKKTYWEIGKTLATFLENEPITKADLFRQLESELSIPRTMFFDSLQFYTTYNDKIPAPGFLKWTHIRSLMQIQDEEPRELLEQKILRENLGTRETQKLVKEIKTQQIKKTKKPRKKLTPKRETPYIYALKDFEGKTRLDLGFHTYIQAPKGFKALAEDNHYSYRAELQKVIDGDTIWVLVDLGFGIESHQKLRFRGIDTPPLGTIAGDKAKAFVEEKLKACPFIMIHSYWRDKFDRYLVDVFYSENVKTEEGMVERGTYLNQELLDEKLAELT